MIIFLSGKAGAGKDEFAKVAVEKFGFTRVAFADALKEEVEEFCVEHGIDYERRNFWGTPKDKERELKVPYVKCAKTPDWFLSFLAVHGRFNEDIWHFSARVLLQYWGTELRRSQDPDYWVKQLIRSCEFPGDFVITDGRFVNELDACKNIGALTVRIFRPETRPTGIVGHPSESGLDHEILWDKVICNSGSLKEYRAAVEEYLREVV